MKKVEKRAFSVLLIILCLMGGVGYFVFRFFHEGEKWINFTANKHIYSGGMVIGGAIYDREGNPLLHTVDGKRRYSDDEKVRAATMHIVGDRKSNVATSLQKVYANEMISYNIINGTYSVGGMGNYIYTTLDPDVCVRAYELMEGKKGAVCVFNYKTGEVLCLVSTPTYDPENPPVIRQDDDAYEGVYINRALSSRFPPGSSFKTVTAAAAIEYIDDIDSQTFNCKHTTVINGQKIVCSGTHGEEHFREALRNSCNVAFGEISVQVGWEHMSEMAAAAGITTSHKLSGIPVIKGRIASSGGKNELAWTGIGQNTDEVNPYSMMRYMGIVANGGVCVEPYLVEEITTSAGLKTGFARTRESRRVLSQSTADHLAELMRFTVSNGYGDRNFPEGMEICAKTGTAEVDGSKKSHGWFVGFSQNEKYPYAFAVVVQNGGSGYSVAKPIAAGVLEVLKKKTDQA